MAGHQQTDQMAASLASQGLQEDAVPFNSTPLHQNGEKAFSFLVLWAQTEFILA